MATLPVTGAGAGGGDKDDDDDSPPPLLNGEVVEDDFDDDDDYDDDLTEETDDWFEGDDDESESKMEIHCLFCDLTFSKMSDFHAHTKSDHEGFQLSKFVKRLHLDSISFIKCVNFVRKNRITAKFLNNMAVDYAQVVKCCHYSCVHYQLRKCIHGSVGFV